MNKNPKRPSDNKMDSIMSKTFNPLYKSKEDKHKDKQNKLIKEIFKE